jgi:hypothetical protein
MGQGSGSFVRSEWQRSSSRGGFCEGWRVGLDDSHGLGIIDLLFALGTFVQFEVFDGVVLAPVLSRPLPPHPFDFHATAGRTFCDFIHDDGRLKSFFGGNQKVVRVLAGLGDELSLGVDRQAVQVRALDDVQHFSAMTLAGTDRSNCLVDRHCIEFASATSNSVIWSNSISIRALSQKA